MEMTGEQLIPASQRQTWDALNDPEILKACVPGCESIDRVGDDEFTVLMTARVGPVSAKFKGKLAISDQDPPNSYAIAFEGQGGVAGFGKGSAKVTLVPQGEATRLGYQVKASVGGKLAQIGSRLVDAAAKKIADSFFDAFNAKLTELHGGGSGGAGGGQGGAAAKGNGGRPAHGHGEDPGHGGTHAAGADAAHDEHHPAPVPRDPDLPSARDSSLAFFAAGSLVVFFVSLFAVFG